MHIPALPPLPALRQPEFLPMTRPELNALGWNEIDVLLVTGDAYVDHPSFGMALLGRWLVAHGFRVGIVAQPRWEDEADLLRLGRPRLFAGVTAGALDSMLAHYTAFRKKRSDDAYTPGGQAGNRPNRACIVYANLVRRAFPGLPVALGGIEASLRRATHYDFWTDGLRRSILLDAKAELLCYGMAERQVLEIARRLHANDPRGLAGIPGTVRAGRRDELPQDADIIELPAHEAIQADPRKLMEATLAMERQVHGTSAWAVQETGGRAVIMAPPAALLDSAELDTLYALPFARRAHPAYSEPIPAEEMIRDSVTTHRGCGGGCSFCSLALHQGRRIASRSRESVLSEVRAIAVKAGFRGSISDLGGPSANMWGARCTLAEGECRRSSCLTPKVCTQLRMDHRKWLALLREAKDTRGVKHVRVASGVRYDLAMQEPEALADFVAEFVGGQLKIAPEHVSQEVLALMRKPGVDVFERLLELFERASRQAGKEQYVVPYLMSAFPGCEDRHMDELKAWLAKRGWKPRQVQCFIPLPGTVAAAMYFAGIDPKGQPIPVARTDAERLRQHGRLVGPREERGARPDPRRKPDESRKPGKADRPGRAKRKPG
ncbi:YgiQ family radical SAM protein [Desulfocurvibacter africanus]|uniref:YgiQ family radical SAM protein n=1 Tax=Desulfocurvibacter africanus TaxID=873 RepID=UPI00054E75C5